MLDKISEIGWSTTATAFLLNIGNTMLGWKANEVLTLLMSIFSLIYLMLRIIEKIIIIRRERRIDALEKSKNRIDENVTL